MTDTSNDVPLRGCRTQPLMSYLKALGTLRLISEQADHGIRGYWKVDGFHLLTSLDEGRIVTFFVNDYEPTPILAPWNGGSGFYQGDNREALETIKHSQSPRLTLYGDAIRRAEILLEETGISEKPKQELKLRLMKLCRQRLPDKSVQWLDAAYVLSQDKPRFPPILGTGANDGRLEFSKNFMQRIVDVLPVDNQSFERSRRWLRGALFGEAAGSIMEAPIGQFDPGGVGGPNATQGFEGGFLVNPWDYVLMIEGALLFAGSVARRLVPNGRPSETTFPFTVMTSRAGRGVAVSPELAEDSRGEMWMPIWKRPSSLQELSHLFSEGRSELRHGQVRYGVDFVRAATSLGVDRGIEAFERYAFAKRSGRAYLAVPMGRFNVTERSGGELLHDIDRWLGTLRRVASRGDVPPWALSHVRLIEDAIFRFLSLGSKRALQDVLVALSDAEKSIAASPLTREKIGPLQGLSASWLYKANDDSPEFRLAASLASLYQPSIRMNLEPIEVSGGRYAFGGRNPSVVWTEGSLERNLASILKRRSTDAIVSGVGRAYLAGRIPAGLKDIELFLMEKVDDKRISKLIWPLALLELNGNLPSWPIQKPSPIFPRAYALLKLLFLPRPLRWEGKDYEIKEQPEILSILSSGESSTRIAARRLRASGLVPAVEDIHLAPRLVGRLAAALLFPISPLDASYLGGLILKRRT